MSERGGQCVVESELTEVAGQVGEQSVDLRGRRTRAGVFGTLALFVVAVAVLSSAVVTTVNAYGYTRYESVDYAELTVKIDRSIFDGPGEHLLFQAFLGDTIAVNVFKTQFIQDMEFALGLNSSRIFVRNITRGEVHYSWLANSVIVNFQFQEKESLAEGGPTVLEAVNNLTAQIQDPDAPLFDGLVTDQLDPLWGLQAVSWDMSLKLAIAIELVGGDAVVDGDYINWGSMGLCYFNESLYDSEYCEFDRMFTDDISLATNVTTSRIQILFVKRAALDAVLVHFRITPPRSLAETSIVNATLSLAEQVHNVDSLLYQGNFTLRVDRTWGLSGNDRRARTGSLSYTCGTGNASDSCNATRVNFLEYSIFERERSAYDVCRVTHRCPWGVQVFNQTLNEIAFHQLLYEDGTPLSASMFYDFENWRIGTLGWAMLVDVDGDSDTAMNVTVCNETAAGSNSNVTGNATASSNATASACNTTDDDVVNAEITGAHFDPQDFPGLGPVIPNYLLDENRGLVLDRGKFDVDLKNQQTLVNELRDRVSWIEDNIDTARLDADNRARLNVRKYMTKQRNTIESHYFNELDELRQLNTSQCVLLNCTLLFNTSSLRLTGAINDTGVVATVFEGDDLVEAAVFAFESIYIGPEVNVTLIGQRPLVLLSRTTAIINTTFVAEPGTIGGFPGGYSVARPLDQNLIEPEDVIMCQIGEFCPFSNTTTTATTGIRSNLNLSEIVSNNVNGPGSGNLRVSLQTITTTADEVDEIQMVSTWSDIGETLRGTFTLHLGSYSTPPIPHDATAVEFKRYLEENLNAVSPNADSDIDRTNAEAGIGIVNVSRSAPNQAEGYNWTITFGSHVGNVEQITVMSQLEGVAASVSTTTLQEGNHIGGTFTVSFDGETSRALPFNVRAADMKEAILTDMPSVVSLDIEQTDPTGNCNDGLCSNGPTPGEGLTWTITMATEVDNVTPLSPTSPLIEVEGGLDMLQVDGTGLTGDGVEISHRRSHSHSLNTIKAGVNLSDPFSLAYGGMGASYGGQGGEGFGDNPVAEPYNDDEMTHLLGGSGGAMGLSQPFLINAAFPPQGRGGHGGGAIEIVAANDIQIGTKGVLRMDGGDAEGSNEGGGGGGSGGAVVLSSGGTILVEGIVSVKGGDGGPAFEHARAGGGGGGGRIAMYAQSISLRRAVTLDGGACGTFSDASSASDSGDDDAAADDDDADDAASDDLDDDLALYDAAVLAAAAETTGEDSSGNGTANATTTTTAAVCSNHGEDGTLYVQTQFKTLFYVDQTTGAEGTSSSMLVENFEELRTASDIRKRTPYAMNGPELEFNASNPDRVTFYTKLGAIPGESNKAGWGAMVGLISTEPTVHTGDSTIVVGVFIGESMSYGSNFNMFPDELEAQKHLNKFFPSVEIDTWYKIDILMDWTLLTFDILVEDVLLVNDAPFIASYVNRIGLYTFHASRAWFDELFLGQENMMNFRCPEIVRNGQVMDRPDQHGWGPEWVVGQTSTADMQRHVSHILEREEYQFQNGGLFPVDGEGHRQFTFDIKFKSLDGDHPIAPGDVYAGVLLRVPSSQQSRAISFVSATKVTDEGLWTKGQYATESDSGGKFYWYGEHNNPREDEDFFRGGIGVCSTDDFISWKFEGIAFHYINLTDMVFGSDGPFVVERPKVLYNPETEKYIMWMNVDDGNQSLGMAGVAVSDFPAGPFELVRTFFPDGNETRDQTVYRFEDNSAFLARTYYNDVEYIMPEASMQPLWESVKDANNSVMFGLSYHRAWYESGYDNYHDIFLQRWRGEDKPWEVYCVDRLTGENRSVEYGTFNSRGEVCDDPFEFKLVVGQGFQEEPAGMPTRFQDPSLDENNQWTPDSVPSVRAQEWQYNYKDGLCGIRIVDEDIDELDPILETDFTVDNRGNCSNIADNPIHGTPPDKLIGVQRVVESRRAKYVAISRLSDDFLDTTGIVASFEGELEDNLDLVSMLASFGQWDWAAGTELGSTFEPPQFSGFETAPDFDTRFHQFEKGENDRASYSLACVLDGQCPVNFRDQITDGHK